MMRDSEGDRSQLVGAGNAEMLARLGPLRLFRRLDNAGNFVGKLFKLNLVFWAILLVAIIMEKLGEDGVPSATSLFVNMALLASMVAITVGTTLAASLYAFAYRPRALKVTADGLVLAVYITEDFFTELTLPYELIKKMEVRHVRRMARNSGECLVIGIKGGITLSLPWEEVLNNNSETSLVNTLETWAPGLFEKRVEVLGDSAKGDRPAYTELWLHEFATSGQRVRGGLLESGQSLAQGRFTVVSGLGGGGQGNTYLATVNDGSIEGVEEVVLKEYILPVYRGAQIEETLSRRFSQEAEILSRLKHSGVVKLYSNFVEDYRGYLALEYVKGQSLKELVSVSGAQPEAFAVHAGQKLCLILKYLHEQFPPIIHRDLSPDNVMFSRDGEIKLVDFNVARQLENANRVTVVGKHSYIPPEQFRGKPTCQSDIFALGCTLFHLVTGRDPEPLSASSPIEFVGVSRAFDDIVSKSTQLDAKRRYTSAEEMFVDLSRVLND